MSEEGVDFISDCNITYCPYDDKHIVLPGKLSVHTEHCPSRFVQCPFNSDHSIRYNDLKNHLLGCDESLESFRVQLYSIAPVVTQTQPTSEATSSSPSVNDSAAGIVSPAFGSLFLGNSNPRASPVIPKTNSEVSSRSSVSSPDPFLLYGPHMQANPIGCLYEYCQATNSDPPRYLHIESSGPGHAQTHRVKLVVKNGSYFASGSTIQEAKKAAAVSALAILL